MTARIGKALTFSNVVASLALFIALGGTVYAAGKISGKQIKPSSLPGNRLKPRTITARRIKAKTLTGRQIKRHSLTGSEIDQGTLTGISAAALADVRYQVLTVPLARNSADGTTATVGCPPGTSAIGGGATVSDDERAFVNDSGPSSQQAGWTATGFVRFGPGNTMSITAVCVAVGKPGTTVSSGTGSSPHPFPIYESAE
ncbi:MAG TPA: hypothetical protein VF085_06875 [Solirubrobacterales bacterium]